MVTLAPSRRTVHRVKDRLGQGGEIGADALAMTAQAGRYQLDRAQGAAATLGRLAGTNARRFPLAMGLISLSAAVGGTLMFSHRARSALRSGIHGLWQGRDAREYKAAISPLKIRDAIDDEDAVPGRPGAKKAHQEALLDEGLEESFPASDPLSVKSIT